MKKISLLVGLLLVIAATLPAQQVLPLYIDSIPNSVGVLSDDERPTLTVYTPSKEKANGCGIIIFPGGGYSWLATSVEGTPIAQAFVEKGFTAFVVKYRLPKDATMRNKSMGPLMDAQQAIKTVRDKGSEYNLNPNKIGIIGYSAGGHLASTIGTHFDISYIPNAGKTNLRPDFMILVYPVISMNKTIGHSGSRRNLLGPEPKEDLVDFFTATKNITAKTPPTYITHTGDDQTVRVENSIEMYNALQKGGVNAELHLYPKGNHGFTLRQPVNEWLNPILLFLQREGF